MPTFTDQIGHSITLDQPPGRIISLVPSQTELLHTLGLDQQVIGITKFCVHPESWFRTKTRIGGTKDIRPDIIADLKPDLIIAGKEENVQQQVEALMPLYPVWTSDVHDLPSALDMIRSIGALTGTAPAATSLATGIAHRFALLSPASSLQQTPSSPAASQPASPAPHPAPPAPAAPRTAYLIWRNPYMAAGGDTFIHDILSRAGLDNVFKNTPRYPSLTPETLKNLDTQLILLSSEPYPFQDKHRSELKASLPHTRILLVDGELFSWYGSRLLQTPAYLQQLSRSLSSPESAQNVDL